MLVRRTEDPEYWRKFAPDVEDTAYVRDLIIETAGPMAASELARAVVYRRIHEERERIRGLLERGRFYRPADSFEEGEELVFPALEFATGMVVGKRDGRWPGHEPFHVIEVQFESGSREFASGFQESHRLNESVDRDSGLDEPVGPAAIFERFGGLVPAALEEALSSGSEAGFAYYDHRWFLRELMPNVHIGYLNLAEAVIEVAWEQARGGRANQRPLTTDEILAQMDIQGAPSKEIARFALELALGNDERFADVGGDGGHLWLLRRLIPEHVLEVPARLRYEPVSFSIEAVPTEVLSLVWGIADELSTMAASAGSRPEERQSVEFVLTYPHWRAGTMPVTPAVATVLPRRDDGISVVTLVDEANSERLTAWVSHKRRFVSSLGQWYASHQVPAGAYITLGRTASPEVLTLGYRAKRRTQREYVRLALVEGDKLTFEIRRQPMGIEFDETMIIMDENTEATDRLWRRAAAGSRPVSELLREVFPELAKLSPQGSVHFNTLYTAVNVLRRCPPEPILAELSLDWRYVGVGSGYYAMDERVAV